MVALARQGRVVTRRSRESFESSAGLRASDYSINGLPEDRVAQRPFGDVAGSARLPRDGRKSKANVHRPRACGRLPSSSRGQRRSPPRAGQGRRVDGELRRELNDANRLLDDPRFLLGNPPISFAPPRAPGDGFGAHPRPIPGHLKSSTLVNGSEERLTPSSGRWRRRGCGWRCRERCWPRRASCRPNCSC